MANIQKRYTKIASLGEGAYGSVYKAIDTETGLSVAIKQMEIEPDRRSMGIPSHCLREVAILMRLHQHPNILKVIDFAFTTDSFFIVSELLECDLRRYMESFGPLSPSHRMAYLWQILSAVEYCHIQRIAHRDLKPQNILVDAEGNLRVADFGLCHFLHSRDTPQSREVVTLWYRAPEILLGKSNYFLEIDMWSVGCVFAEMLLRKPLFPGDSEIGQLFLIFRLLGTPSATNSPAFMEYPLFKSSFPQWQPQSFSSMFPMLDPDGLDLLSRLLRLDPAERITAEAALSHPYFNDLKPS
jgi:serine/threonine protein kinase